MKFLASIVTEINLTKAKDVCPEVSKKKTLFRGGEMERGEQNGDVVAKSGWSDSAIIF